MLELYFKHSDVLLPNALATAKFHPQTNPKPGMPPHLYSHFPIPILCFYYSFPWDIYSIFLLLSILLSLPVAFMIHAQADRHACTRKSGKTNKHRHTLKKHTWRQNGIPKNTHNTCRRTKKRTTQMYIYAYLCCMQWNTWQQNLVYLVKKAPVRWFCDSACNHSLLEGH